MSYTQSRSFPRLVVIETNSLLDEAYFAVLRTSGYTDWFPLFSSLVFAAVSPRQEVMSARGLIPEIACF